MGGIGEGRDIVFGFRLEVNIICVFSGVGFKDLGREVRRKSFIMYFSLVLFIFLVYCGFVGNLVNMVDNFYFFCF